MVSGVFELLIVGLVSITIGIVVLLAMVHFELGPTARLAGRRRMLFAAALGSGILAFTLKLLLIVIIARFPHYVVDPFIERFEPGDNRNVPLPQNPLRYSFTPLPTSATTRVAFGNADEYVWESLPLEAPAPDHNPTTPAKVVLGRQLFFDKNLSRDGTLSCASCHDIDNLAGADGRATSVGIDGQIGQRNAPTVWNAAFQAELFWDGRAASLEQQARGPLVNPIEMGMSSLDAVVERVRANPDYTKAFSDAFGAGTAIDIQRIAEAIAAYERTLITPDTPYDRFVRGDLDALTPAQRRGMATFASAGCINCHFGPNFSAASLFDSRAPKRPFPLSPTPLGERYDLTGRDDTSLERQRLWRVPSLRNVALTGPWLHNGSVETLEEMVRIMANAQLGYSGHYLIWSNRERVMREVNRPELDEETIRDIVAFLNALSSDRLRTNTD